MAKLFQHQGVWMVGPAIQAADVQELTAADRRRRLLLLVVSALVIVDALAMAMVLGMHGLSTAAELQAFCVGAGMLVIALVLRGALDFAAQLFCVLCYAFVLATCLWLDVPSPSVPRVTHAYLLPLYMAAHLVWPAKQRRSRAVFLGACLVSFVALVGVSNPLGVVPLLTDDERAMPGMVAAVFVAMATAIVLRLQLRDVRERSALELDLARAIATQALDVHLQPQCDGQGRILAAEALVRWQHPVHGAIPPAHFIPVAERTGLIVPLGQLVMARCCEILRTWRDDPRLGRLGIAVNVSALQVSDDEAFNALLAPVHADPGLRGRLKLELTESALAGDTAHLQRMLTACREVDVKTSLDDFGTGYSALSYLDSLSFDQIKVDRSFVHQMCSQDRSRKVVEAIVRLGRDLGMEVIAEGVETEVQRAALEALGCHLFQGYLFGRPVSLAAFEDQVRAQAASAPQ